MRRLSKNNEGAVAIVFAGGLVALLSGIGAAVDFSRLAAARSDLQKQTDAAALAAARIAAETSRARDLEGRAVETAREVLDMEVEASTITVSLEDHEVRVRAEMDYSLIFGKFLGMASHRVGSYSVARFDEANSACILALDEDAPSGIETDGAASLKADLCTIWSNSESASAISRGGSSILRGHEICAVGGASGTGMMPRPQTGCAPLSDPFAERELDTSTSCSAPPSMSSGGSYNLVPGSYCGMDMKGEVHLEPGIYTIVGDPFRVSGNARIRGDGVTFILADMAFLEWSGTPRIQLNAPTHGSTAGIVIAATRANTATSTISGNVETTLESEMRGSIYLPAQQLVATGNASLTMHDVRGRLVAGSFSIGGHSHVRIFADDDFLRDDESANIRLTQ